jgi:HSP20 family protein
VPEQMTLPAKKADGTLRTWDPFEMFETIQEEVDQLRRLPWAGIPTIFARPTTAQVTPWIPRMDVYEKDNTFFVKAELPGVKKEDIQVELDHGTLTIRGQSKAGTELREAAYYRMERTYGTYYRRVPVPFEVAPEQVQATVTDGVLEIRIAKPTETKPETKKIAIG